MKKGDVVVRIGELEVNDMMGYMEGLSMFEAGETTEVEVLRNGSALVMSVTWD
jgi:S1-C subfamily serine protease